MKPLRRATHGVLIAAAVFSAYACAVGADDGSGGSFASDSDASTDAKTQRATPGDGSTRPPVDTPDATDESPGCAGKVVINELMAQGSSASDEFIELYNGGSCAIPLGSWKLAYRSASGSAAPPLYTFPAGAEISAKTFMVIATTQFSGKKDAVMNGGMASTGGQVALVDDGSKIIDGVGYGSATAAADGGTFVEKSPAPAPPNGGSVGRRSDGVDTDDNSADFETFTTPSAGAANQ